MFRSEDKTEKKLDKAFMGSGWSFPVAFSIGNYQLNVTAYEQNINDSIRLILNTNYGERNMEPYFGSGLQQFFFRTMNETLKGEMISAVKTALLNNEPRIKVMDVSVTYVDLLAGLVEIDVTYIYNITNTRHNYIFPFYLKEGTNL
jgi:phage baseplate assembly protein W